MTARRKHQSIELTRENIDKVEKLQGLMGENLRLTKPGLFGPECTVSNMDFVVGAALDYYIHALEMANVKAQEAA